MKVGTKSLLFGVHQFAWHPFTVWLAWRRLYGRPTWRECVCILIHDWGYWGCADMDGEEGKNHPIRGALIAHKYLSDDHWWLVLLHSRSLAARWQKEPSRLCWADKLSMVYDPQWFYLIRARATGELAEYRANAAVSGFLPITATDTEWHSKLIRHLETMAVEKAAK